MLVIRTPSNITHAGCCIIDLSDDVIIGTQTVDDDNFVGTSGSQIFSVV